MSAATPIRRTTIRARERRYVLHGLLMAVGLFAGTSVSSDAGVYDGNWHASFLAYSATWEVDLSIQGTMGTWRHFYMPEFEAKLNPCYGRDVPITVLIATSEELKFEISRSKVFAGCSDRIVDVKPVDRNTLSGWIGNSKNKLTMVRR